MKHNLSITLVLLGMFVVAQLIGLAVINAYSPHTELQVVNGTLQNVTVTPQLPYGMQPPEMKPQISVISIIISILIATAIIFLLTKLRAAIILKGWFFVVVVLAVAVTLNAFFSGFLASSVTFLAFIVALPIAFYKVFERNLLIHNFSELLIYPGIAAIFVPILNVWAAITLLVLIALYDMYAVWKAKFMQKLAKFQIEQLGIFAGFFIPYVHGKDKVKLQQMKQMKLSKRNKKLKNAKIKVNLAILGGGDVAFPLIFAGVLLRASGLIPALIVVAFATISLFGLFLLAKKGKFYPAMPFLSSGCIIGWLIGLII